MSMARLVIIGLVLLAAAATAPAASAHFPQSLTSTVPANGEAGVISSPIPPTATSATITAEPAPGTSDSEFGDLTAIFSGAQATRGQAVLFCVAFCAFTLSPDVVRDDETAQDLGVLWLNMCLHIALTLQPSAGARAAAAGCPQQVARTPVTVTRTGGRYHATINTTPSVRKRLKTPVRATCRRKGRGFQIRLRSRARGKPLRRALGAKIAIGYLNRSRISSAAVKTSFAVR